MCSSKFYTLMLSQHATPWTSFVSQFIKVFPNNVVQLSPLQLSVILYRPNKIDIEQNIHKHWHLLSPARIELNITVVQIYYIELATKFGQYLFTRDNKTLNWTGLLRHAIMIPKTDKNPWHNGIKLYRIVWTGYFEDLTD